MLRAWIEDVISRLKQLGTHADGLEDENRKLQAELCALHEARRGNDDTFTVRQWDPAGAVLVDTLGPEPARRPGRIPGIHKAVSRPQNDAPDRRARHRRARAE